MDFFIEKRSKIFRARAYQHSQNHFFYPFYVDIFDKKFANLNFFFPYKLLFLKNTPLKTPFLHFPIPTPPPAEIKNFFGIPRAGTKFLATTLKRILTKLSH